MGLLFPSVISNGGEGDSCSHAVQQHCILVTLLTPKSRCATHSPRAKFSGTGSQTRDLQPFFTRCDAECYDLLTSGQKKCFPSSMCGCYPSQLFASGILVINRVMCISLLREQLQLPMLSRILARLSNVGQSGTRCVFQDRFYCIGLYLRRIWIVPLFESYGQT